MSATITVKLKLNSVIIRNRWGKHRYGTCVLCRASGFVFGRFGFPSHAKDYIGLRHTPDCKMSKLLNKDASLKH